MRRPTLASFLLLLLLLLPAYLATLVSPSNTTVQRGPGMCVAYGLCDNENGLPCVNNTAAQSLAHNQTATALLADLCPHISSEESFCCSPAQISFLAESLKQAESMLKSCGHCYTNFRSIFCDIVCHPNQSEFADVAESEGLEDVKHVTKFTYYLSDDYGAKVYNSCSKFGLVLCGASSIWSGCSKDKMFAFLGDNSYTTLKTDFLLGDDDITPFRRAIHEHITPCDDFTNWDRCTCAGWSNNCEASCNNDSGQDELLHRAGWCISRELAAPGTPRLSNEEAVASSNCSIPDFCPSLSSACCTGTVADLTPLETKLDEMFGACGNCRDNLRSLVCQYFFSEDQSLLTNVAQRTEEDGVQYIEGMQLVLSDETATKIYASCEGVQTFAEYCQDKDCTLQTILTMLFSELDNTIVPELKIYNHLPYVLGDEGFKECNDDGEGKCACADCAAACKTDDGLEHKPDHCLLVDKCSDLYFEVEGVDAFQMAENRDLLTALCPFYQPQETGCCNDDTIALLATFVQPLKEAASCGACGENIASLMCSLTCSSNQSESVLIQDKEDDWSCDKAIRLRYYVDGTTMHNIHDSCKSDMSLMGKLCPTNADLCQSFEMFAEKLGEQMSNSSSMNISLTTDNPYDDIEPVAVAGLRRCDAVDAGCSCETCVEACETNGPDGLYHSPKVCLMYSTCHNSNNQEVPCLGNYRARYQDEEILTHLAELCPSYDPRVLGCCDTASIGVMDTLLSLAKSTIKCPNCYYNLAKLFCNVFCNENQSTFLTAVETSTVANKTAVSKFRYFVSEEAGLELYESCKSDRGGITDTICITRFGRDCSNDHDFIHAIGDNGVTTFSIDFKFATSAPMTLDTPHILTCEEKFNGASCYCEDCPAACNTDFNDGYVHERGVCLLNTKEVVNNTKSFAPQDSALLRQVCPEISDYRRVCCDDEDLEKIRSVHSNYRHNLGGCLTCYNNIRRYMCHIACSPDQSSFTTVFKSNTSSSSQLYHFLQEDDYTQLHLSCAFYHAPEEAVSDSTFYKEILGKLVSELYTEYEFGINERDYTSTGVRATSVQGLKNCYDAGIERCECEYCQETCTDDGYQHAQNMCLFYDICQGDFPCINNTAPVLPDASLLPKLLEICPQYGEGPVCCTDSQLGSFSARVSAVKIIIGSCPACYRNFVNIFCRMMCDPHQSSFQQVISEKENMAGAKYADKLRYHISEHFAESSYDSCKHVKSGNTRAVNLICDSIDCDLDAFYVSLGINQYTELKVFYEKYAPGSEKSEDYRHFNITPVRGDEVFSCNDTIAGDTCSCADCPASCGDEESDEPSGRSRPYDVYLIASAITIYLFLTAALFVVVLFFKTSTITPPLSSQVQPSIVMTNVLHASSTVSTKVDSHLSASSVAPLYPSLPHTDEKPGLEPGETRKPPPNKVQLLIKKGFRVWAEFVFDHPFFVCLGCSILVGVCAIGLYFFRITYDPVELWTTPTSGSRLNKNYFEEKFGTPYRTAQLIFTEKQPGDPFTKNGKQYSSIFREENMRVVYEVEKSLINTVQAEMSGNRTIVLSDVCYKPLGEHDKTDPTNNCVIMSPFQWQFGNYKGHFFADNELVASDVYLEMFEDCGQLYLSPTCFGAYRGPVMTNTVFGGYNISSRSDTDYLSNSKAVILTFVISGEAKNEAVVMAWEKEFIKFMKVQDMENLTVSFNCERALEDELNRASHADIMTIVISYILMFVYVSTTLGKMAYNRSACCIQAKVSIGLVGVTLVLISVTCALGITSYFRLPATLIVIEVVPFLVLAVGVDNVYILVQSLQKKSEERQSERDQPNFIKKLLVDVVSDVGPSMLMSSTCQTVAFSLGALSTMPAVQNFAWNAALAVFIDFLLQISVFVVILTMDTKREFSRRSDCVCCAQFSRDVDSTPRPGPVRYIIEHLWAEILFKNSRIIRPLVVSLFLFFTLSSVVLITHTDIGLDESLALPADSHLVHYFHDIFSYLNIGPEVQFVFRSPKGEPLDVFEENIHSQLIDSDTSLYSLMKQYSADSKEPYLTGDVGSWLTKFEHDWLTASVCCRHRAHNSSQFCPSSDPDSGQCEECETEAENYKHLHWYLDDVPEADSNKCVHGGKAQYGTAVKFGAGGVSVEAAYFTLSHPRLSGSNDFISSRRNALKLADEINKHNPDLEVFPYSSAYHFYEQYDTIVTETGVNLAICIFATFVVSFVMLGFQLYPSLVILVSITMVITDMMGVMMILGIPLNAISLVNLIMSVGIAVEFVAHIVKSYASSPFVCPVRKAKFALVTTGPSVFSGITLTKFVGIVVLAFAKSKLFEVFYFRMFLSVIVLGATHSLIFLPALLSLS